MLKAILDDRAARVPERRIALFEDGTEWTWGECRELVRAQAAALQALGVRAGDRVIAWLPNGPALVRAWFSINYLGAVFVPLNTAYRGATLEHTINACRAKLVLAHPALIERLEGLSLPHVERVITVGADSLEGDAQRLDDSAQPQPWDAQSIIYTSGTTGLSKGVLSPYLQLYTTATIVYGYLREGEGILVNLPMFHVGGTSSLMIALIRSGSFHLVDGFSTDRFWDQVRRGNCTTTSGLIGIMGAFLMKSAPRPDDRQHPIRCMTGFPINEQTVRIRDRFGIDYLTGFNMTELSAPLVSELNTTVFGACGKPRSGVECRIVDANDMEVPDGSPGELIVRSEMPWTFNLGYDGLPEATAQCVAQRLVPHRRHPAQGRRRQLLLRRPPERRDPPPRRERVVARSRGRRAHASGRRRGDRSRDSGGVGRRSDGRDRREGRSDARPARVDRVAHAAPAVLRGAAVRAHRRRDSEDRDEQAAQIPVPRSRRHAGYVGSRGGRDGVEEREVVGLKPDLQRAKQPWRSH